MEAGKGTLYDFKVYVFEAPEGSTFLSNCSVFFLSFSMKINQKKT